MTVEDRKAGPREPRSTVLSEDEEPMIVAFWRDMLLLLDVCISAFQPSTSHLTRSSLHRCLQRHRISHLTGVQGNKPKGQEFKRYPMGFFHIYLTEVRAEESKLHLLVAIERTRTFALAQLVEKVYRKAAWEFLERLLEAVPYLVHADPSRQWHSVRRGDKEPDYGYLSVDAFRYHMRDKWA